MALSSPWPLHALHHCSRNYYCLIGLRKHPVQVVITHGARLTVLLLIGTPAEVMALYTLLAGANSMIQHTNLRLRFGFLSWIFATQEIHRWHHSRSPQESNTNYGDILIIWDVLFGTRVLPDRRERLYGSGLGLPEGTRVDNSYWGHLKMPSSGAACSPAPHSPVKHRRSSPVTTLGPSRPRSVAALTA